MYDCQKWETQKLPMNSELTGLSAEQNQQRPGETNTECQGGWWHGLETSQSIFSDMHEWMCYICESVYVLHGDSSKRLAPRRNTKDRKHLQCGCIRPHHLDSWVFVHRRLSRLPFFCCKDHFCKKNSSIFGKNMLCQGVETYKGVC